MIAYVGRGYYKEHIIPVFSRVAPFPRDFPFHIHSRLPINAVQFTILSIIAMVYKPAVAHFGSELSSIFLANFDYATIDKTLFYGIFNRPQISCVQNTIWTCTALPVNRTISHASFICMPMLVFFREHYIFDSRFHLM